MKRRLRSVLAARTQLRMRVMAGVVAVTLAALAVFDLTAVTTMHNYLYAQTRSQLDAVVQQARGELPALISATSRSPGGIEGLLPVTTGQFDIAWLPAGGRPIVTEIALNGGATIGTFSSAITRTVTKPGVYTTPIAGQMTRLDRIRVSGGSIVAGTTLTQVKNTLARIELIVMIGSAAVVLLIGAGVFMVLRLGLRPIEAMAAQADRITAGDLAGRVAPRNPRSEVGRLGRPERHAHQDRDHGAGARGQPGADAPVLRRRQSRTADADRVAACQRRTPPARRPDRPATSPR